MTKPVLKQLLNSGGIPPFPLPGVWDTVADVPTGAVVLDGGVVKQSLYMFNNDGADFVDFGRPSFLSQLRPSADEFTIVCVASSTSPNIGYIMGLGESDLSLRQLGIRFNGAVGDKKLSLNIGGQTVSSVPINDLLNGELKKITIKVSITNVRVFIEESMVINAYLNGSNVTTSNLYLGMITNSDPTFLNFEGKTSCIAFYSGVGDIDSPSKAGLTKLDNINFANWDGGPTVVSEMGNVGTVTDGIPTTAHQKDLIPVSLKC